MEAARTTQVVRDIRPVKSWIRYERRFTAPDEDPFDTVEWSRRDVVAGDFSQQDVEAPDQWGDQSVGIVAKLYFATVDGVRERSVRQMVARVVDKICDEMLAHDYFGFEQSGVERVAEGLSDYWAFHDELVYALLHQYVTFNSPVWFNLGVPGRVQMTSACFLLSVEDRMVGPDSITDWWAKEALIFKGGAGSGISVSKIRGSMEPLSTGGIASGPVAYMRPADAGAGTLKSGGQHRRAAKLVRLDVDHPDIEDFIACKLREDDRMRALVAAGFDLDPTTPEGERNLAECTSFQNENLSVGVTDEFMRRATGEDGPEWGLMARKTGDVVEVVDAPSLLRSIATAAWSCADPGMQYHDTINSWHTTPSLGPITTSNVCLPGDTLIDTSEGRITIEQLVGDYVTGSPLPYVFSWDTDEALPALRRIRRAFFTKMATDLVEVRTVKGVVFRCTPEHRVLTRIHGRGPDGDYVQAQDLKPGDRLRKVSRHQNKQRSGRFCLKHRETPACRNGTRWQSIFMWEQAYGPIPHGMEVHHLNEDPTDDRLSNFELVDSGSHQAFHSGGERNSRFIDSDTETLVEVYERAIRASKFGRLAYTNWSEAVEELDLVGVVARGNSKGIRGLSWSQFQDQMETLKLEVNDSVESVTKIGLSEAIPVYDLEVEGLHNFAVASEGVDHTIIVHNCGEIVINDDSACNLASFNVLRYMSEDGDVDVDSLCHHIDMLVTAMDATCSFSDLPTPRIERNTRELRQLGLGFSNLGAALMARGLPYDSDEGRDLAASITALMTGRAYQRSAELAEHLGAFEHFEANRNMMLSVVERHISNMPSTHSSDGVWGAAWEIWHAARAVGGQHGYRNSQVTTVQPGGTTSFMMGCDTTGVEPAFSLVSHKSLAGGGSMTIVNGVVERALYHLGYDDTVVRKINAELADGGSDIRRFIRPEHAPVFQAAVGEDAIDSMGHVKMVAAIQPHLSQAVSKTVNMPSDCTVEDVERVYVEAWRMGLKGISIYRDGSKATQVLRSEPKPDALQIGVIAEMMDTAASAKFPDGWVLEVLPPNQAHESVRLAVERVPQPHRRHMPRERQATVVKFVIDGHKGYLTIGLHEDGTVGEIFLNGIGKDGSTLRGMADAWATDFSIGLQHGVPLETLVRKHAHVRFPPEGATGDPDVPTATSIPDFVVRKIAALYLDADTCEELGVLSAEIKRRMTERLDMQAPGGLKFALESVGEATIAMPVTHDVGASCRQCGGMLQRTGSCWICQTCFASTGCG